MKGWLVLMLGLSASAATAHAQQGEGREQPEVPAQYAPPPGMCRVWLAGVPAAQQPAPTDCASAIRKRPNQGRVLFGSDREMPRPALVPTRPRSAQQEERQREERRAPREPAGVERRDEPQTAPRAEVRKEPRAEPSKKEPRAEPRVEAPPGRARRPAPPPRSRQSSR
jgi:hypothetical protein